MARPFLLTFCLSAMPLLAQAACLDDVNTLAGKYHVDTALPSGAAASSPAAVTDRKLAQSGGVIAPPATGDLSSATPSVPGGDRMQTAPALPPQAANGQTEETQAAPEKLAASDAQASSLLQAAREAARTGNDTTCRQRLADARALLEKAPSRSQ